MARADIPWTNALKALAKQANEKKGKHFKKKEKKNQAWGEC